MKKSYSEEDDPKNPRATRATSSSSSFMSVSMASFVLSNVTNSGYFVKILINFQKNLAYYLTRSASVFRAPVVGTQGMVATFSFVDS